MRDKLQLLIDSEENLTRSGLAKMLGINPATISQILAGRNKPSYELLQKILQRFTNLSADWLLLDREPMLRNPSLTPSGMPRLNAADSRTGTETPTDPNSPAVRANYAGGDSASAAGTFASPMARPTDSDLGLFGQPSASPTQTIPPIPTLPSSQTPRESNISDVSALSSVLSQPRADSHVERVVVFYSDKTFDTYIPKR